MVRGPSTALAKSRPSRREIAATEDYPQHERALLSYQHWTTGQTEDEIADLLGIRPEEVLRDVRHIQGSIPVRTVIAHNNDRNRILLQHTEAANYRKLLGAALQTPVDRWLAEGITPAPILREYREAVGATEKPGGFSVHVTQNAVLAGERHGVSCSEDLLRRVMARLEQPKALVVEPRAAAQDEIPEPEG